MKLPSNKIESAVSKTESHYNLQGVKLDVAGKRLLATDGYIAAVVPCEVSPEDHDCILPLDSIKMLRAMSKRCKTDVTVNTNGKIIAEACGERMEATPLPGDFPNIDRVMPEFSGEPTITLNASLLVRLAEALVADPKRDDLCVSLWIRDAHSSILVKPFHAALGEVGVLMPVAPGKKR